MTNEPTKRDTYIMCAAEGDTLPDVSKELSEMGRGSLQRRCKELQEMVGVLERELTKALNHVSMMLRCTGLHHIQEGWATELRDGLRAALSQPKSQVEGGAPDIHKAWHGPNGDKP